MMRRDVKTAVILAEINRRTKEWPMETRDNPSADPAGALECEIAVEALVDPPDTGEEGGAGT
jgi:hypothetical protein